MTDHSRPALTDAKGMGGIIAQDGFDYQIWDTLVRLPAWLRTPAFEGLTAEGLEDLEARFFAPHAPRGHILDRFQAKSALLTRGQVVEVFRSFAAFDDAHPGVARAHVLVTPALPKELQWLARDTHRVRRARPFYAPFVDVVAASDEKLQRDIVTEFGLDLGGKVARSFEVALRTFPDRSTAESMFAAELAAAFPDIDPSARKVALAFRTLADHIASHRGRMVDRGSLIGRLTETLGTPVVSDGTLPVHIRSDRNGPGEDAIEIDASPFSLTEGPPPSTEEWQDLLVAPLDRTARWANRQGRHRLRITGSYRISTGLTLGWSFRAANGFELDIQTRTGDWATDERPGPGDPGPAWEIVAPERLREGRLVVSVGVLRDPAHDVRETLSLASETSMLSAYLAQPITSGRDAQAAAQTIKNAVVAAVARLRPEGIDLFFAGPAALAVALGHRWNAMPPTHLHEFRMGEGYLPTVMLQ